MIRFGLQQWWHDPLLPSTRCWSCCPQQPDPADFSPGCSCKIPQVATTRPFWMMFCRPELWAAKKTVQEVGLLGCNYLTLFTSSSHVATSYSPDDPKPSYWNYPMYLWPQWCSRQSCSWQHSSHCRLALLPSQSCTLLYHADLESWPCSKPCSRSQRSTVQPLFYSLLSQASQIRGSNSEMEPGDRSKLLLTVVSRCLSLSSVATFLGCFRLPQANQWNRKSKVHPFQAIAIRKTSSHLASSRRSASSS